MHACGHDAHEPSPVLRSRNSSRFDNIFEFDKLVFNLLKKFKLWRRALGIIESFSSRSDTSYLQHVPHSKVEK